MSVELIGVVLTGLGVVITLGVGMLSGFGWMVRRIDRVEDKLSGRIQGLEDKLSARIQGLDDKLSARIQGLDDKLSGRIDGVEDSLSVRIAGIEAELTEVKIGIARLEGPRPHLIIGR